MQWTGGFQLIGIRQALYSVYPTWALNGSLYVGDVFFVQEDLDAFRRVLRQLSHLPQDLPHRLRVKVLHVGAGRRLSRGEHRHLE
jgi:hypothetical protein